MCLHCSSDDDNYGCRHKNLEDYPVRQATFKLGRLRRRIAGRATTHPS
jgi:hypothetical protein